jgi:hypothetical protein
MFSSNVTGMLLLFSFFLSTLTVIIICMFSAIVTGKVLLFFPYYIFFLHLQHATQLQPIDGMMDMAFLRQQTTEMSVD